jgi:single-strand DNA-binding protein
VTEVIADNVRFLESANSGANRDEFSGGGSGGGNNSGGNSGGSGGGNGGGNRYGGAQNNQDPFSDDGKPIDISDDDLPF